MGLTHGPPEPSPRDTLPKRHRPAGRAHSWLPLGDLFAVMFAGQCLPMVLCRRFARLRPFGVLAGKFALLLPLLLELMRASGRGQVGVTRPENHHGY
jgi:hypothetical protein